MKFAILILTFFGLFFFSFAYAQGPPGPVSIPIFDPLRCPAGAQNCLTDLLDRIIGFLLTIAAPLATLIIIIGALVFIFSGGKPENVKTARNIIIYALIGVVILVVAKGLTMLIVNILKGP